MARGTPHNKYFHEYLKCLNKRKTKITVNEPETISPQSNTKADPLAMFLWTEVFPRSLSALSNQLNHGDKIMAEAIDKYATVTARIPRNGYFAIYIST